MMYSINTILINISQIQFEMTWNVFNKSIRCAKYRERSKKNNRKSEARISRSRAAPECEREDEMEKVSRDEIQGTHTEPRKH